MAYAALYRKWRPITFDSVVGQEAIIQTLCNQIETGRIAHAYLFCGTRGTGKTTTAKIFSRAVNCTAEGGIKPCNQCPSCISTLDESNMDVIEMDAASNNGVDDIRELRENVKYPPSNGRYKVYIIDEVHMLSKGAFNALLKTLEEPPGHVLFILATTEPHKIPPTIHSRCQRFDFKRVPYDAVLNVLREICESEGRTCDSDALSLIVQASEGAMRDALSILDRCLSFESGHLDHSGVLSILGLTGDRFMIRVFKDLADRNIQGLLDSTQWAVAEGKDLQQAVRELVEFSRKLMLLHVSGESGQLLDLSAETRSELKAITAAVPLSQILNWMSAFSQLESESRWTPHPRALMEKTMVQLVLPEAQGTLTSLTDRVERIESALKSGIPAVRSQERGDQRSGGEGGRAATVSKREPALVPKPLREADGDVAVGRVPESKDPVGLDYFEGQWTAILNALKKARISTYALLVEGTLAGWEDPGLIIAFDERFEFHRMALEKEENRSTVEAVIRQVTGRTVRLRCVSAGQAVQQGGQEEWIEDVQRFFTGYEDQINIQQSKEE